MLKYGVIIFFCVIRNVLPLYITVIFRFSHLILIFFIFKIPFSYTQVPANANGDPLNGAPAMQMQNDAMYCLYNHEYYMQTTRELIVVLLNNYRKLHIAKYLPGSKFQNHRLNLPQLT